MASSLLQEGPTPEPDVIKMEAQFFWSYRENLALSGRTYLLILRNPEQVSAISSDLPPSPVVPGF